MLGNIANDLDNLLTDLCPSDKPVAPPDGPQQILAGEKEKGRVGWTSEQQHSSVTTTGIASGKSGTLHSGTVNSGDTLGKDSFFSSAGNTSRRHGDGVSSNHSLVSLEEPERRDDESIDSGHDGRARTGPSPLVFEPSHFASSDPSHLAGHRGAQAPLSQVVEASPGMDELRSIPTVDRLAKTNSIWLLAGLSRAGAVHILKDRDTGIFIVRKSSQAKSLALSVHSRLSGHPVVDHYLIEGSEYGFRLQDSQHFFHSVPALIAYYVENREEIRYHLRLPVAIQQAKTTRELASLDMLGQDFWVSPISRKSPSPEPTAGPLQKSCSEPINIQHPVRTSPASRPTNTVPSRSATDFSNFMTTQAEMEKYFARHAQVSAQPGVASAVSSVQTSHGDSSVSPAHHPPPMVPSLPGRSLSSQSAPEGLSPLPSSLSHNTNTPASTPGSFLVKENCSLPQHDHSAMASPSEATRCFPEGAHHRLNSDGSWLLTSSPLPSSSGAHQVSVTAQQPSHSTLASPRVPDTDIYSCPPSNQPAISSAPAVHPASHPGTCSSNHPGTAAEVPEDLPGSKTRAWTHPRPEPPKGKSNLYLTTNLGLLEIPENSYFTSNLSDKLSDYEDIWRTSCAESDVERQNVQMLKDPRSVFENKVGKYSSGLVKEKEAKVKAGKKKVLRKTTKDSPSTRRTAVANRDSVTGGTTGLTALEQARMIAGSVSEDELSPLPVAHVQGIQRTEEASEAVAMCDATTPPTAGLNPPVNVSHPCRTSRHIQLKTSQSLDFCPPAPKQLPTHHSHPLDVASMALTQSQGPVTCASSKFTASMSVIVSESSESSRTKVVPSSATPRDSAAKAKTKVKPSPLSRLSRLKSSSESSLATVSSPMYAEPVDAVKLRDKQGKAINIQVRRRSAPISQNSANKEKSRESSKVSQNPHLDTIFSPGAETQGPNPNAQTKFSFESPSVQNMSKSAQVTRSQSMNTPRDPSGQLQRKSSWKDRLNRLKLGTKVLTRSHAPPTAVGSWKHGKLDSSIFTQEHGVQTSPNTPSSPGKFPLEPPRPQELVRASCFSESSTVQDLISCSHPELSVKPIAPKPKKVDHRNMTRVSTPPSEYDNMVIYRASTHSSQGTVYSPPWEGSTANRLMKQQQQQQQHQQQQQQPSPAARLPPAMDLQERVQRWQEANSTYQEEAIIKAVARDRRSSAPSASPAANQIVSSQAAAAAANQNAGSSAVLSQEANLDASFSALSQSSANQNVSLTAMSQDPTNQNAGLKALSSSQDKNVSLLQQRQQLLHHQHLLKMEEIVNAGPSSEVTSPRGSAKHRHSSHVSMTSTAGDVSAAAQQQQRAKAKNRLSKPDPSPSHPGSPTSPTSDLSKLTLTPATPPGVKATSGTTITTATTVSTSPHRLSSHCPDVVNCHSAPLQGEEAGGSPRPRVLSPELSMAEDDVLFGGELVCQDLQQRLQPVLSPHMTSTEKSFKNPGTKIREYIFKLSSDQNTIFGSTIVNFIQCTLDSHETNPQHIMRNVRQFMTGIKNYLVKHGEGELEDLIERERNKLGANEILNIDAIMEQALHVCVLKPLKYHIYKLFVDKYKGSGALEQLSRNIKYARSKSAQDIGVKPGLTLPSPTDMEVIKHYLDLMQRSYSPLQKLQNLLKATSTIYHCVQGKVHHLPSRGPSSLGADDFLPLLIYVIIHCGLVSAEIEADFMWGLLQPSLLTGEGGYYLTTLSSAVLILKNFQDTHHMAPNQLEGRLPTIADMQGFLKIAIPDELHGHITWKTLPVRPNMNTRDVCAMVAHKFKVTNPQDYGLFLLKEGTEVHLGDSDCPQIIKGDNLSMGKDCYFAFKRVDANIAWPKHMKHSPVTVQDI